MGGKLFYFTKARQGSEKSLEILPMPDGLGWKISQFEYEGETKSKESETKEGCVRGPKYHETGSYKQDEKVSILFRMVGRVGISCPELTCNEGNEFSVAFRKRLKVFCSQGGRKWV